MPQATASLPTLSLPPLGADHNHAVMREKARAVKEAARLAAIERLRPLLGEVSVIPLTKGWVAIVDADLFEELNQRCWYACAPNGAAVYAACTVEGAGKQRRYYWMHRAIMGLVAGDPTKVDHRRHEEIPFVVDNRRSNLRVCSNSQNSQNSRTRSDARSRYKGVAKARGGRWRAHIHPAGGYRSLGTFGHKHYAALAYDYAARQLYGEYALTNFPTVEGPADTLAY